MKARGRARKRWQAPKILEALDGCNGEGWIFFDEIARMIIVIED